MPFEYYLDEDTNTTRFRSVPVTEYTQQGQQAGPSQQGAPAQPQSGQFQQMPEPEHPRDQVPPYAGPTYDHSAEQRENTPDKGGMLTRDEVDRLISEKLAERDRDHAAEVAKLQAQVPQLVVSAHGGGPGNDNHLRSWSLADQEAARRGDDLDHWHE